MNIYTQRSIDMAIKLLKFALMGSLSVLLLLLCGMNTYSFQKDSRGFPINQQPFPTFGMPAVNSSSSNLSVGVPSTVTHPGDYHRHRHYHPAVPYYYYNNNMVPPYEYPVGDDSYY